MRFLLDESMEFRLAGALRQLGHDVTAIAHDYPHALTDHEVLAIAHQERRVLLTNDRDFGELILHHGLAHAGVIYFRLPAATADRKLERLEEVLRTHADRLDQFITVTPDRVRVRPAQSQ